MLSRVLWGGRGRFMALSIEGRGCSVVYSMNLNISIVFFNTKHLFVCLFVDRPFRSWHMKESSSQQNKRWKLTLAHFVHHCSRRQLLLRHREFQICGSTEGLPSDSFTSPIWFAHLPYPGHTASCKASNFRRPPRVTVVYNKLSFLEFLCMCTMGRNRFLRHENVPQLTYLYLLMLQFGFSYAPTYRLLYEVNMIW